MTDKYVFNKNPELNQQHIDFFNKEGYLVYENFLNTDEVKVYADLYDKFLSNQINASDYRRDLSGKSKKDNDAIKMEGITQIMLPSTILPELSEESIYQNSLYISRQLLGDDMCFDFDMLIDKPPYSNKYTRWHQDAAYLISNTVNNRMLTCWVAIDDAVKENGCMWYVPGSHLLPLRKHWNSGTLLNLECEGNEDEAVAVEIKAGSCIFHHGNTLHYSRGNSTNSHRRAFIISYKSAEKINFEKQHDFKHFTVSKTYHNFFRNIISKIKNLI